MALIPTGIASRVVSEREQGLKHMQVIGGVTVVTYWVSFFLLDLLISSIPSILISCILFYTEILPSFSTPLIPKMFIVYPFVIIP
jgi:ATP-binding cassette subfamily A (ABC1) protein 3